MRMTQHTGNHDRSGDAKYLATGAEQPTSVAGPHEESDGAEQDYETHKRGHHQDAMRGGGGLIEEV